MNQIIFVITSDILGTVTERKKKACEEYDEIKI